MAIRLRKVNGMSVALCAAETDPKPGDVYLDDGQHYALAALFAQNWQGETVDWQYPDIWADMETQKLRDARTELLKWLEGQHENPEQGARESSEGSSENNKAAN